jgi:NADH dehydrogenase [ubiquinone] 1 alpha subcomplex assembly factor 7
MTNGAAEAIARMIRREGPIPFDRFVEHALYEPAAGFFAIGRGAGRAGRDFVTSPEVGPLFGACVARALDREWEAQERPDPFLVIEAGAGRGRLAREVLRAQPACASALHYVLVERSAALQEAQREALDLEPADEALGPFAQSSPDDAPSPLAGSGPVVVALDELPALELTGVVIANELLDNLPFGIAEHDGARWHEVRVGLRAGEMVFEEVLVPAADGDARMLHEITAGLPITAGARLPIPRGIEAWLEECSRVLRHGVLVAIDYVDDVRGVLERGSESWLRTYRAQDRGGPALDAPGDQDLTADIVREQVVRAARASGFTLASDESQADWLRALGIDDLVNEGSRSWEARAHIGDLEALAGRSRATEAAALCDPGGLGAHRVLTFSR